MATVNKFILATVICNMFIIVGIGHGGGPIGLIEPMFLQEALRGEIRLTLLGGYSSRLPACALLSLLGQLILIFACFLQGTLKRKIIFFGLGLLHFALLALSIGFSGSFEFLSLLFAFPFYYASIRLLIVLFSKNNEPEITGNLKSDL